MKTILTTAFLLTTLTTAPAYAQSEVRLAIELGELQGFTYCAALNHGVRTKEQMKEVFLTVDDVRLDYSLYRYDYWKSTGNQEMVDLMVGTSAQYAIDHCPVLFQRYLQEND